MQKLNDSPFGKCPKCNTQYKLIYPTMPVDLYCQSCSDIIEKQDEQKKVFEAKQRREEIFNNKAGEEYKDARFKNFLTPTKEYEKIKNDVLQAIEENKMITIVGNVGTGKTHLCIAIFYEFFVNRFISTRYRTLKEIFDEYTKHQFDSEFSQYYILDKYKNTQVLIIDEITRVNATEFQLNILHDIIDHRYRHKLLTILVCNAQKENFAEYLTTKLGAGVVDRIFDTRYKLLITMPDQNSWRQK